MMNCSDFGRVDTPPSINNSEATLPMDGMESTQYKSMAQDITMPMQPFMATDQALASTSPMPPNISTVPQYVASSTSSQNQKTGDDVDHPKGHQTSRPSSASSFNKVPIIPPIHDESGHAGQPPMSREDSTSTSTGEKNQKETQEPKPKKVEQKFHLQEKDLEEVTTGVLNRLQRLHGLEDEDFGSQKPSDDLIYLKEASRYGDRGPKRLAVYQGYTDGKAPELFRKIWKICFEVNFLVKENRNYFNNMKDILIVLWNGTDMSKPLCDKVIAIELHKDILHYLSDDKLDCKDLKSNFKKYLIKGLMGVMNNCIQMTDCIHSVREGNGVSIFTNLFQADDKMVACKALMVLAYLITEEENEKINGDDHNFSFITEILKTCLRSEDLHSKRYGFSAHEIVQALNRLASSDNNKERIIRNGALQHYVKLLQPNIPPRDQELAARGIWTLAFKCADAIFAEPGCIQALQDLATNSPEPAVRRQANGALWILKGSMAQGSSVSSTGKPIPPPPPPGPLEERSGAPLPPPPPPAPPGASGAPTEPSIPPTPSTTFGNAPSQTAKKSAGEGDDSEESHVFISYNWGSKPTMLKVKDRLKQAGYRVWMDVEDMSGSILEAMALAVEKAAVVIICFSQKYKASPNCRTEAEYTFKLRKSIIPLRLQYRYVADGWLGALLGNKLFYDFSQEEKFEDSILGLIRELGAKGHATQIGHDETELTPTMVVPKVSHDLTAAPVSQSGVGKWKNKDVDKWLEKLGFKNKVERFRDFDGGSLIEFKHMLNHAPDFFYTSLKQEFGFSIVEILKFSRALKDLDTY